MNWPTKFRPAKKREIALVTDPYRPLLTTFAFTDEEELAIRKALATENPWGWNPSGEEIDLFKSVKNKIRDFHMERQNERCCYCRRDLQGAGHFMIDREHILPKSKPAYRALSFTIWNLSISCKRCNMEYKGEKVDFIVSQDDADPLDKSENYRFVHPNFDQYEQHLSRLSVQHDEIRIVKFTIKDDSAKGGYTYEFFNLAGLECQLLDEAQGATSTQEVSAAGARVRELAEQLGLQG